MIKKGGRARNVFVILAVIALVYLIFNMNKSGYSISEQEYAAYGPALAAAGPAAPEKKGCAMDKGVGLASSLLPREVASQEDFGEFTPEDVLKGQNFLEPRQQTGYPESVGGALRNANQQIRAEPPNPKDGYVWNNSTIAPDEMQRSLC
jgi:hypothetical protein